MRGYILCLTCLLFMATCHARAAVQVQPQAQPEVVLVILATPDAELPTPHLPMSGHTEVELEQDEVVHAGVVIHCALHTMASDMVGHGPGRLSRFIAELFRPPLAGAAV